MEAQPAGRGLWATEAEGVHGAGGAGWGAHSLRCLLSLLVNPELCLQFCPLSSAQPCLWGCLAPPISSLRPSLASASSRKLALKPAKHPPLSHSL